MLKMVALVVELVFLHLKQEQLEVVQLIKVLLEVLLLLLVLMVPLVVEVVLEK